jgi:hypothetical protein
MSDNDEKPEPYILDAPNGHMGQMLLSLHGDPDNLTAVDDSLAEFNDTSHLRERTLLAARNDFNQAFSRGAYNTSDLDAFLEGLRKDLLPDAVAWGVIEGYIDTAMDVFDCGARERQDILAAQYQLSGKRPPSLVIPSVGMEDDGSLIVMEDNVVIHRGRPNLS